MNYADLRPFDTINVISGIASSLFVSGCNFNCIGCFNKEAQNFSYGKLFTKEVEDKFIECIKNPHVKQASLLGGEIFHQDLNIILHLVKRIKEETGKPIYIWTGARFENLIKNEIALKILQYIDVIIDGRFEIDKKDINLRFMGSSNQRAILVKESLVKGEVVEI